MTPAHNHALQAIYSAAFDPSLWQGAIDAIARVHGAVRMHLLHADTTSHHYYLSISSGYSSGYLETYAAYYGNLNLWAPAVQTMPVGVPQFSDQIFSNELLRKSEFYADWILPQEDIIGGGAVVLDRGPGQITALGGNVPSAWRDRLDIEWHNSLSIFGPVVRHALLVNKMLLGQRLEVVLTQTEGAIAATAILLLDQTGRLLFCDPGGARILETGQMLHLEPRLRVVFADEDLNRATRLKLHSKAKKVPFRRRTGASDITLCPLDGHTAKTLRLPPGPQHRSPAMIVLIQSIQVGQTPDLATRLGLTAAEADLARLLADGKTLAEIAEARRASIHTVRNQIKSALSKTGTRRQAELVGLVERSRRLP